VTLSKDGGADCRETPNILPS